MFADTDYQSLANTLVGIYGDKALEYARRNANALGAGNAMSEQAAAWIRVAGMVERMVTARRKGRRQADFPHVN